MRSPILLFLISCLSTQPVLASSPVDGFVDTRFGNAGLMRLDPTVGGLSSGSYVRDVARAATSGRFYVLASDDLGLARVNVNGTLDTSFGIGGYATYFPTIPNEHSRSLMRVSVSSSGKPVIAGSFYELEDGVADGQGLICRYNVAGSTDDTFDGDGCRLFEFDLGGTKTPDAISALWPLPGDAMLIAGTAGTSASTARGFVAKLLANGSYDTSFGLGGLRYFNFPDTDLVRVEEISVGNDGHIYVAGGRRSAGGPTGYVVAFDASGDPLPGYGSNGVAQYSFASTFSNPSNVAYYATGLVVDGSGNTTHCGYARDFTNTQLLATLARFDANGQPVAGFGGGTGRLITSYSELNSVNVTGPCVLDRHGRLTLSMHTGTTPGYDPELALMRFRIDGSLDTDFQGSGELKLPLNLGVNGVGSELVADLIAQGDDLVLFGTATHKYFNDEPNTPHEYVAVRLRDDRIFSDNFETPIP